MDGFGFLALVVFQICMYDVTVCSLSALFDAPVRPYQHDEGPGIFLSRLVVGFCLLFLLSTPPRRAVAPRAFSLQQGRKHCYIRSLDPFKFFENDVVVSHA